MFVYMILMLMVMMSVIVNMDIGVVIRVSLIKGNMRMVVMRVDLIVVISSGDMIVC